ncbi:hypothetical protein [Anabaena azotica]|uniref:hypothetical protein n=1 Tax=Anabaena azotica TaxID=197653 RepID=UPI0039A6F2EA
MAASVTTTATTLEGQVFECVQKLQLAEQAITTEPIPNNVTIAPDVDNLSVTLTVTLPMTFAVGTGGKMEITPTAYV